jgi:tetratricopeptide (TPR) repeat protein
LLILRREHGRRVQSPGAQGYVWYLRGDYAQAEERANASLEILKKLYPDAPTHYAASWRLLGRIMTRTGRAKEAEPLLRKVLDMQRSPTQGLPIASTQNALGECLTTQKRFAEAEPLLVESYTILNARLGPRDPRTKEALGRLVELYDLWGKPAQAAQYRVAL